MNTTFNITEVIKRKEMNLTAEDVSPTLSGNTLYYHFEQHHRKYEEKTLQLLEQKKDLFNIKNQTKFTLENIIKKAYELNEKQLYNNASQLWNHNFLVDCMKNGTHKSATIIDAINESYGSEKEMITQLKELASSLGAGWIWFIKKGKKINMKVTELSHSPLIDLKSDESIILCIDLWEHAYYLDYQFNKIDYIENYMINLVNWNFVEERFLL